jgi:hypothetical protein
MEFFFQQHNRIFTLRPRLLGGFVTWVIASLLHKRNQNHDFRNIVENTEYCSRWDVLLRMSRTDNKFYDVGMHPVARVSN